MKIALFTIIAIIIGLSVMFATFIAGLLLKAAVIGLLLLLLFRYLSR